jgi:hypothetical protein
MFFLPSSTALNCPFSTLQPVRQALLTVWKYCFERQVPPVLVASSSAPDGRIADRIFGSVLPQDRLVVHNPDECYQSIEQVRGYVLYQLLFMFLLCGEF